MAQNLHEPVSQFKAKTAWPSNEKETGIPDADGKKRNPDFREYSLFHEPKT
jgi:hypothetical protein